MAFTKFGGDQSIKMSRPVALLVLAAVLACMANASAHPSDDDDGCDFAAPTPMLSAQAYKDYNSRTEHPHVLIESATLPDRKRVELRSHTCVDSFGNEVAVTIKNPPRPASDTKYWVGVMQQTLSGIAVDPEFARTVESMTQFLTKVASLKMEHGRAMLCANGSAPTDGECGWDSGGGFVFRIEKSGGAIVLHVAEDHSG
jgi:hypothetical protein